MGALEKIGTMLKGLIGSTVALLGVLLIAGLYVAGGDGGPAVPGRRCTVPDDRPAGLS